MEQDSFDVLVLGAGGAGLMCALQAARRGRRTALIERSAAVGRKILISGGGRCNFTNLDVRPERYVSKNPDFSRSALARFTPHDFIRMVEKRGIPYHEKKLGQLFCDRSAKEIVEMLVGECREAGAQFFLGREVRSVEKKERFRVETDQGELTGESLVVATGGLSLPKTGATDLGYRIARQFGLGIVETAPALDGFVFGPIEQASFRELSGLSVDSIVACGGTSFHEALLFTHSGLSGPAALQASLYWQPGQAVRVDFLPALPGRALEEWLLEEKGRGNKAQVKNLLAERLPRRFCEVFCALYCPDARPLPQVSDGQLSELARRLHDWSFIPAGTVGYQRAEVTRGGVDTAELSSKTMESLKVPGLYFIGEVVDVTGWLGGYNFQWAWASGWAAGQTA